MKLKSEARSQKPEVRSQTSGLRPPSSEQGIALVITLILLSVTLFMAVAFLAISRRERGSVLTETDNVTARLAAGSALAHAEAQILATVLQTTNPYNFSLTVSTNYQNASGYFVGVQNPTNVNYDYLNGGGNLAPADFLQNVANLLYSPRAPVFAYDRTTGTNEFRFYLDLNRNRQFDANGLVDETNSLNQPTGAILSETGDPEWIGVLERPDAPHGPNNKFLSRYAFIALPAGNTLDLNAIHNQAFNQNLGAADGYFRNQGGGSWEINLAAFLADLNTNEWDTTAAPYQYLQPGFANNGFAFQDAFSLLNFRYNNKSLPWASTLFINGAAALASGPVDIFPFGPAMTTTAAPFYNYGSMNNSWPGADNTNHFFALASDLFDPAKGSIQFTNHLSNAGAGVSTYDRYTFYRMLAQLGTDSAPETGKMNLNYDNLDPFFNGFPNTNGTVSVTNFAAWTPIAFFTNAADRMLRAYTTKWFQTSPSNYLATYYGITDYNYYHQDSFGNIITNDPTALGLTNVPFFGMTNQIPAFGMMDIPVLVNGKFVYSSAVQRVLQLAANIYDATTNSFYPSVFRPLISRSGTNVYITSYTNVVSVDGANDPQLSQPFDVATIAALPPGIIIANVPDNIYGVPWIIGAKKGFPNFNEFCMESSVQVTRKLEFNRNTNTIPASGYTTNQMYSMAITNYYGLECWNSYFNKTNYTGQSGQSGPVVIAVRNLMSMTLTNQSPYATPNTYARTIQTTNNPSYLLNSWPSNLFVVPLNTNAAFFAFTNPVFAYKYNQFGSTSNFLDSGIFPLPQFGFVVTNYLQVAIIDNSDPNLPAGFGHIVDYVQLGPLTGSRDINREIADLTTTGLWSTNLVGVAPSTLPQGVVNQYYTSRDGKIPAEDFGEGRWATAQVPGLPAGISSSPQAEQVYFRAFFSARNTANYGGLYTVTNLLASMQAPYTPTRTRVQRLTWQANDPLVHYLGSDLIDLADDPNVQHVVDWPANLGSLNNRYMPWGGNPNHKPNPNTPDAPGTATAWNMALKDPLVSSSDYWDFPTFKLPSVGWLGRVHRGTPWQTVYLKASNILKTGNGTNVWKYWTGNYNTGDAINAGPLQDRLLFDLFTTALNDNATRGQLPINVAANDANNPAAGLAAWSAVFSGIVVPTNSNGINPIMIDPAGANTAISPLYAIVTNINYMRAHFTNTDGVVGSFEHVGDILSVSKLAQASPFLAGVSTNIVTDALMEWLPQQTLSLLRVADQPRFVIYSYGQTLTPAPNGVVTSGGAAYSGMITNYQVTAETVTRSVVRIEGAPTNAHAVVESYNILPPD
ncbi:MAG: hypothetical protein PHY43_04300 [Verrucomicrobiales bacterium]|nr:hypothetical protein [Verrucomicrobiales bacterium]